MEKIVIISATNRPNSNTLKVSSIYQQLLAELGCETLLLDFRDLPHTITVSETFGNRTDAYAALVSKYVTSQHKFLFVVPEYNGSFPGILKTFLDSVHPREWNNKKACLVGVAEGRAGNLRGMDHLTGVLQYLKMHVFYNKLPISVVHKLLDANGQFPEEQVKVCRLQVEGFIKF